MGRPGDRPENGERAGGRPSANARRDHARFEREVAAKQARLRRYRRAGGFSVWFGLGMYGLVGWSVAIPMVLGTLLGVYLDRRFGSGVRWTLGLMALGLIVGGATAWSWVEREREAAREGPEDSGGPDGNGGKGDADEAEGGKEGGGP